MARAARLGGCSSPPQSRPAAPSPTQATTDADYRLGQSGRADEIVTDAGLDAPDTRERPHHARSPASSIGRRATQARPISVTPSRCPTLRCVDVGRPAGLVDRPRRAARADQLARDGRRRASTSAPCKRITADVQSRPSRPVDRRGRRRRRSTTRSTSASATTSASAERLSLPDHARHHAARVRRADRGRNPRAAGDLGRRRDHRPLRADLLPRARASRPVSSMVLLIGMAVGVDYSLFYLKREREERAARPQHARRRRDRRRDVGALDRRLRRSPSSSSMAGLYVVQDADVRVAGHWRDHRRRRRRARLADRACRRCWRSSAAGSTGRACRCCGGSTGGSGAAASAVGCSARCCATRRRRCSSSTARRRRRSPCPPSA